MAYDKDSPIRTDQVFEAVREAQRAAQKRRPKWGCMLALVLSAACGVYLYVKVPVWLDALDRGFVPYLASKGRALAGRLSLRPIFTLLDHCELSGAERSKWKEYIDKQWAMAVKSDNKILRREDVIEFSSGVVGSVPGLYYSLLHIRSTGIDNTVLNPDQRKLAREVITRVTTDMVSGRYSEGQLAPVRGPCISTLIGVRVDSKSNNGPWETDTNRRALFRILYNLDKSGIFEGDGEPIDMQEALRSELEAFKARIAESTVQDAN